MLTIPIDSTEWRGRRHTITVDQQAEHDGTVDLTLEAVDAETFDDRDIDRNLTADEARALAAALWHFADMAERSR